MDGVTGVGGGGQRAGLVQPLTPEAHADERLGSLQVVVLNTRFQFHGVHVVKLRTSRRSKVSKTNRDRHAELKKRFQVSYANIVQRLLSLVIVMFPCSEHVTSYEREDPHPWMEGLKVEKIPSVVCKRTLRQTVICDFDLYE